MLGPLGVFALDILTSVRFRNVPNRCPKGCRRRFAPHALGRVASEPFLQGTAGFGGGGGAWGALPCLARGISALWLEAQKDRTNLLKEAAKVTSSKTSSGSNTRKYVCLTSSRRAPSLTKPNLLRRNRPMWTWIPSQWTWAVLLGHSAARESAGADWSKKGLVGGIH